MKILHKAMAGTLESSDVLIEIEPGTGELVIEIQSIVKKQFGGLIENAAAKVLEQFAVEDAMVYINDRGALDCTIMARLEAAIKRAGEGE